jgi:hypothetical protein
LWWPAGKKPPPASSRITKPSGCRAEPIAFVNALLKPRAPTAHLRKAAAKYRQQTGL